MFIAERLISRSSVALSVSIGYALTGTGRGTGMRSRGPDDDRCIDRPFPSRRYPHALPRKFDRSYPRAVPDMLFF